MGNERKSLQSEGDSYLRQLTPKHLCLLVDSFLSPALPTTRGGLTTHGAPGQ
ncbi:unnamed protein product [Staurois parvus]|uniref:Uncharacterized protein n=1 Tax=Staurois parvus TaxID=386267 RepID=A0ABN9EDY1_9NEOB|nr:unnamed protein product [Staurois parvus]